MLGSGTRLDGVRAASGAALGQNGGAVIFNNVLLAGNSTFNQGTGSTLNTTGDFIANPQTTITLNGIANATGGSISGALTINNGAKLDNSGSALYLDGTRGTTVNPGGTLSTASGTTIELRRLAREQRHANRRAQRQPRRGRERQRRFRHGQCERGRTIRARQQPGHGHARPALVRQREPL